MTHSIGQDPSRNLSSFNSIIDQVKEEILQDIKQELKQNIKKKVMTSIYYGDNNVEDSGSSSSKNDNK
ncbi:hypothetical protein RclHR1_05670006 [Rhizophagus clarus]|uniref:Uncharacterized protein n=1 Tax=Rhizophagus clarus TaxID=94130 RepID=A0A2Z6RPF8_9GLOM|nr:hypothetical protein RclHR1_05670006 [Rhizophagus clarus]GES82041.1 hypothetical protein GLOIN_2v1867834 [Rhizophagus clarus]